MSGGVYAVLALAVLVAGCKQEVQFTKAPPFGPSPPATVRRDLTTIQIGLPVDLTAAVELADKALPESLGKIVDWIDDAACDRRTRAIECNGVRVDIEVQRNGSVTLALADDGRLAITVPLKYDLTARGLGWASYIRERKSGVITATIPIDVALNAAFEPDARLKEPVTLSERTVPALKGKIAMARHLDARLKKPLAPVLEAIRLGMGAKDMRATTERAWRALYTPMELNREPQTWLRIEPERIGHAGFVMDGDRLLYQLGIGARVSVANGQRPAPLLPRRLPELTPNSGALAAPAAKRAPEGRVVDTRTQMHLPVVMSLTPMLAAVRDAFPGSEVHKTGPGTETAPIGVKVRHLSFFPSKGDLGIEMQLDVVEPSRWVGLIGTAHFVGRPVVRANGILELEAVQLPDHKARAKGAKGAPRAAEPSNVPRIGPEPFDGRIARSARMDLRNAIRDVLPHANGLFDQSLGDGFVLRGRFDEVTVAGVEPVRDGIEITFKLGGSLNLRYEPTSALAAPIQPETPTR